MMNRLPQRIFGRASLSARQSPHQFQLPILVSRSQFLEHASGSFTPSAFRHLSTSRKALACKNASPCASKQNSPPPTTTQFWTSPPTWKRASVNTLRCLVGCTLGDFSALWFLQSFYPHLGVSTIMATSSKRAVPSASQND